MSQPERFFIEVLYHRLVEGDPEKVAAGAGAAVVRTTRLTDWIG